MKQVCSKTICTGCAACMNKCPKQCITMCSGDVLGHLYPKIDQSRCVDCGACVKVCPALHQPILNKAKCAYAGFDKDETEYKSSTSGGAASALARFIIKNEGVVYGCAIETGVKVHHVRIDKLEDINKIKGSKYVQSTIGFVYKQVREDLRNGKKVLFTGTPCQVAGLKSFIGKKDENLYTIDLICHGVPPLKYLQKHIIQKVGQTENVDVSFRSGNGMYILLLLLSGKEVYRSSLWNQRFEDAYYNSFIDGYTYRPSCHSCHYSRPERVSDITVGDFWGLKTELPLPHPYGCSVLLPNTDKGRFLIENIENEFNLYQRDLNEAVAGNDQLRHPLKYTTKTKIFLKLVPFFGISRSYKLCIIRALLGKKKNEIKSFIKRLI